MGKVKSYLSLIKFSHTVFAMPFALIGFFLGIRALHTIPMVKIHASMMQTTWQKTTVFLKYNSYIFVLIIFCMIFVRSAAMAFNRYLDRQYDARNPRTALREIPSGVISPRSALLFTITCCILFVIATYFINRLCFYYSPIVLVVVLGYSYTKRFTPLCHLVLGGALALAPIGAYIAVTGAGSLLPWIFSVCVLCWVSGFDIIYALQDEEFDRSQQLHSIPAMLGKRKALRVSELLHLISAAAVFFAGWYGGFGWLYWVGAAIFTGMLVYQHTLVKPDDLRKVNIAFMTANGIASVVFAIFVIADLFINQ